MNVRTSVFLAAIVAAAVPLSQACKAGTFGSSPTGPSTLTPLPAGVTPAYTQDIKPILDSDCTRCHGTRSPSAGVDLTSYTGVMRVVAAGNANSRLVVVTTSGGSMYNLLSGDRAGKSSLIRTWVLGGAAQNR